VARGIAFVKDRLYVCSERQLLVFSSTTGRDMETFQLSMREGAKVDGRMAIFETSLIIFYQRMVRDLSGDVWPYEGYTVVHGI